MKGKSQESGAKPVKKPAASVPTALLLCMAALAFFLPHLNNTFFADDFLHIAKNRDQPLSASFRSYGFENEDIAYLWWIEDEVVLRYFRPLVNMTIMLNDRLGAPSFPLTNLLFHLIAGLLVLALAREVTGREDVSVAAALIFLFLPAHAEPIFWISGRVDTIVTVLIVGALLLHIQGRRRASPVRAHAGTACFAAALLAKETALVLPVLVVAHDVWFRDPAKPVWRQLRERLGVYLPLAAVSVVYLVAYRMGLGSSVGLNAPYYFPPTQAGFVSQGLVKILVYLEHFVLYIPLMPVTMATYLDLLGPTVAVMGLLLALLAGFIAWTVRGERPAAYFLFWLLLTLGLFTPIMPGERLLYLPSVGFSLVAGTFTADLLRGYRERPWARRITITLLAVVFLSYLGSLRFSALAYRGLGRSMEVVVHQVREAVPEPGPETCFYFIELNLWPVGNISQSLQLAYGEPAITAVALTLSPDPTVGEEAGRPLMRFARASRNLSYRHDPTPSGPYWRREGDRALRVGLEEGAYLASSLTELHLYGRRPFRLGEAIRTDRFRATVTRMNEAGPAEFLFELDRPLSDEEHVFFLCDGLTVRRLEF